MEAIEQNIKQEDHNDHNDGNDDDDNYEMNGIHCKRHADNICHLIENLNRNDPGFVLIYVIHRHTPHI